MVGGRAARGAGGAGHIEHPLAMVGLVDAGADRRPRYRLWAEARAYRIQLGHYPDDRTALFAGFIVARYGLSVSVAEVAEAIKWGE